MGCSGEIVLQRQHSPPLQSQGRGSKVWRHEQRNVALEEEGAHKECIKKERRKVERR